MLFLTRGSSGHKAPARYRLQTRIEWRTGGLDGLVHTLWRRGIPFVRMFFGSPSTCI